MSGMNTFKWFLTGALTLPFLGACTIPKVEGNYTFDKVEINIENRTDAGIEGIIENFERLPDLVQKTCNEWGKVVVAYKPLTDQPELKELKNKLAYGQYPYAKCGGIYNPQTQIAFVSPYGFSGSICREHHEIGHMIDHRFRYLSGRGKFLKCFLEYKDEFMVREYLTEDSREFFAEKFAEFYFSKWSREGLKDNYPVVHQYFTDLEEWMR